MPLESRLAAPVSDCISVEVRCRNGACKGTFRFQVRTARRPRLHDSLACPAGKTPWWFAGKPSNARNLVEAILGNRTRTTSPLRRGKPPPRSLPPSSSSSTPTPEPNARAIPLKKQNSPAPELAYPLTGCGEWWTRTQRSRTDPRIRLEVPLRLDLEPPLYQRIAAEAARLRALGLSDQRISARFRVDGKTVAKAIRWFQGCVG